MFHFKTSEKMRHGSVFGRSYNLWPFVTDSLTDSLTHSLILLVRLIYNTYLFYLLENNNFVCTLFQVLFIFT